MELYLIRHAKAENKILQKSDFERNLTDVGIKEFTSAVEGWKNFILNFDLLISSPYNRAIQTAEIVKQVYKIDKEIITDHRLGCGSRTETVLDMLHEFDESNIAIFGHEPDFSMHLSSLISNSGAIIDFKKGMIAKVSFATKPRISAGTLEYLIPVKAFLK